MIVSHLLITRFNVRVPEWRDVDKSGQKVLSDEWMEHRFALFDKYTVPSVRAQTSQAFMWIVLFDAETSPQWHEKIHSYGDLFAPYLVIDWLSELQELLRATPSKWLLTTRLDNDDQLEPMFMETLQAANKRQRCFYNIPNGWAWEPGKEKETRNHMANPFISYMEPTHQGRSVYFTPHGRDMRKHAPIIQIPSERLWTQIIHERNYLNAC